MENWSFLVRLLFISHPLMTPLPPAVPTRQPRSIAAPAALVLSRAIMKPEMKRDIFINKLSKGELRRSEKRDDVLPGSPEGSGRSDGKRSAVFITAHEQTASRAELITILDAFLF